MHLIKISCICRILPSNFELTTEQFPFFRIRKKEVKHIIYHLGENLEAARNVEPEAPKSDD